MSADEPTGTIATRVPDDRRVDFLPTHFGRHMMRVEHAIFDFMRRLSPDYKGGYWEFYETSTGGAFMVPEVRLERLHISAENGYDGLMTPEAAGITACLYAFSHLSFIIDDDAVSEHFHLLRAFALEHPEAAEIVAAID